MNELLPSVVRARELLMTVKHAAMATVNEDGSPHNTPFFFMHDSKLTKIYWGSNPESRHSKNIIRTGKIFVVLYDAYEKGGLYIKAEDGHALEGEELNEALAIHNALRFKANKPALDASYFSSGSHQRMWSASITNIWVNDTERDNNERIIRDYRHEINAKDLLGDAVN